MIEHITSYVEEAGDISFYEKPFNNVDALVLAQFCYMKWESIIPRLRNNVDGLTLLQMDALMDEKAVFMDERYAQDNIRLWKAMISGKRFASMKCNYLSDEVDESNPTQFCAFTVFPEGALPVVLFRGTDETVLGWKEDFNMAFAKPVPGQILASLYVKQVALRISGGFMICGHSKGGNLAVYSAMTTNIEMIGRIARVYSFDGPGFRPEIIKQSHYNEVANRIVKLIPKSSVVGLILENTDDYEVVKATSVGGIFQHNPYTWVVDGDDFAKVSEVKRHSKYINNSMYQWINELDDTQLQTFMDALFAIIEASGVTTLLELPPDIGESMRQMIKAMQGLDKPTRDVLKAVVKELVESFKPEM